MEERLGNFGLLEALEDCIDLRAALAALKEAESKGTVAWDELKREFDLD